MMKGPAEILLRHVCELTEGPGMSERSDADLVRRLALGPDPAALEALVCRHGSMVLGVCCRVLGNTHDAEDAFQATFLILIQKAASLRAPASVAGWLYGVAQRLAQRLRADVARRRFYESRVPVRTVADPLAEMSVREAQAAFHEELARLPEKYRAPLVLCCLEGRTRDEVARELGCSLNSLKSRLERARRLLHRRLVGRGLTLPAALMTGVLAEGMAPAALRAGLLRSTLHAADVFATGGAEASRSSQVAALVAVGLRDAGPTHAKVLGALSLIGGVLVAGVSLVAAGASHDSPGEDPAPANPPAQVVNEPRPGSDGPALDRFGDPLPQGAMVRLGTVRFRHGHYVRALAFSPDGKLVASGGGDRVVRLWDLKTGKQIRLFQGHRGDVASLAFFPDGKRLVTGGYDGTVRIWQVATGQEEHLLLQTKPANHCRYGALAFSADGKMLAAGDSRRNLILLDAVNFQALRGFFRRNGTVTAHDDEISALAFSPDGTRLASGSWDKTVRVWDVGSGKEVSEMKGHLDHIFGVAFSPDGRTIASAALGDPDLRLWDAATGKELRRLRGTWGFLSVYFSPDGKSLVTGGQDGLIRLWDVATGKENHRLADCKGWPHIALSPDGQRVVGSGGQTLHLCEIASGKELLTPGGHADTVWSVALSPDRRLAATADSDRGIIRFWNATTGEELRRCDGHVGRLGRIAFTPDGHGLVSTGMDGEARLWDVATGKEICHFRQAPRYADSLALSADGKWLASASSEGLRLWEVASGKPGPWPPVGGRKLKSIAFAPDGKLLATGGWDREISLWDAATGKEIRRLEGATGSVYSVAFSPDGNVLASACCKNQFFAGAGDDPHIRFWEVATGRELRRINGPAGGSYEVAFSADGRTLVSAGEDGIVRLWEVATGKERRAFLGHQGPVTAVALARDSRVLLSGSTDTTALVWDVTGLAVNERLPRRTLTAAQLADLWADLAHDDAVRAYRAHWILVAGAERVVPFLAKKLRPVPAVDANQLATHIAALDSAQFAARQQAARALEAWGELAEPALRKVLADKPSLEVRRQVERLLEKLRDTTLTPERLRAVRAVEILEQIASPEARQLLEQLAQGALAARLTREAQAALGCLRR